MVQTSQHDGRITALVARDLAKKLSSKLEDQGVVYELTGTSGGSWMLGKSDKQAATITMDALDFHLLASDRLPTNELDSRVSITEDSQLARLVLANTQVPY